MSLLVAFSANKLACLQVDLTDRGKAQRARYHADCKDPDFEVRFASTTTHVSHLFIFVACAVFNSIYSNIRHCHCNSLPYVLVLDHCFEFWFLHLWIHINPETMLKSVLLSAFNDKSQSANWNLFINVTSKCYECTWHSVTDWRVLDLT